MRGKSYKCLICKRSNKKIDPCMRGLIDFVENWGPHKPLASCCGHGRYPPTLVVLQYGRVWELFSRKIINRAKRFYVKDKDGFYYIPETLEGE